MATVTSFESVQYPTKSELRQFAELFTPLFQASSEEARRLSVAALSQCANVPAAVALFIGCQPIAIAAPFLASSQSIDDDTLITIARTQGAAHAKAIVMREALSPRVIDALVSLRQAQVGRGRTTAEAPASIDALWPEPTRAMEPETIRQLREEKLRLELKQIARHLAFDSNDRLGLRTVSDVQEALLVRFARERDASHFATTLADALSASRWLAERILLDLSGHQLAVTMASIGMEVGDAVFVLENLYPHLAETRGPVSRASLVFDGLDPEECEERVEAWRRADRYTYLPPEREAAEAPAAQHAARPVPPARDMRPVARALGRSRLR